MQKRLIEEPIYETIQTGVNKKEIYVTSDGQEFNDEESAESHEFYRCKLKWRGTQFDSSATLLNLYSVEDLERYENDYTYNVDVYDYDKTTLEFPNTFVLVEKDEYDDNASDSDEYGFGYSHKLHLKIYTLDEYKQHIINLLDELEGI